MPDGVSPQEQLPSALLRWVDGASGGFSRRAGCFLCPLKYPLLREYQTIRFCLDIDFYVSHF